MQSSSSEQAEPNMTPILDMVFQLITFFMLVINFKTSDFYRDLVLPVVGSAAPLEDQPRELLIINVKADGTPVVRGKEIANIDSFLSIEGRVLRGMSSVPVGEPLPVTVVIRADKDITFNLLMRVIDAAKKHGFDKFDFIVLQKAKGT